jgi:beta-lactamase regulating signal transducer with metallopeptidase domain
LAAATVWRLLATPARRLSAHARATILFIMRVGPPAVALAFVVALLIPSYLLYEPYATGEVVSKKLAVLALASLIGVAFALWRGLKSWLATRKLLREWLEEAERIQVDGTDIPAFRIKHAFPVIAVVGSLRPRLFVASHVLDSLSEEEMLASIAHEYGHLAARDNLKRVLMRACRDMLTMVPGGHLIDRAWAENAEAAADESAAARGSAMALNLASALIHIARMVPAGARPTTPVASFLLGDETDGVMGRVRHLLDLATADERQHHAKAKLLWAGWAALLISMFSLILLLINSPMLASLHSAMEHVVQVLN